MEIKAPSPAPRFTTVVYVFRPSTFTTFEPSSRNGPSTPTIFDVSYTSVIYRPNVVVAFDVTFEGGGGNRNGGSGGPSIKRTMELGTLTAFGASENTTAFETYGNEMDGGPGLMTTSP